MEGEFDVSDFTSAATTEYGSECYDSIGPSKPRSGSTLVARRKAKAVSDDMSEVMDELHRVKEHTSENLLHHYQRMPPDELLKVIATQFDSMDRDLDGLLNRRETCLAMCDMGARPTEEELEEIFQSYDKEGKGKIPLDAVQEQVCMKLNVLKPSGSLQEFQKQEVVRVSKRRSLLGQLQFLLAPRLDSPKRKSTEKKGTGTDGSAPSIASAKFNFKLPIPQMAFPVKRILQVKRVFGDSKSAANLKADAGEGEKKKKTSKFNFSAPKMPKFRKGKAKGKGQATADTAV
eukprot:CAMPEP_0181322128 /NCGR_PEP_ID=MMETSP1101-20121128/19062_1 /TAXON_ID=46948 /ORGANISM="Rhodomonas abbreviata, Strain Caron Lab Isolate" /LENGTH=288 /DNA_ID=CAMNT_0023430019 /DNA_START=77 /DNA_END=941 /DNA_ORIENTATION=+